MRRYRAPYSSNCDSAAKRDTSHVPKTKEAVNTQHGRIRVHYPLTRKGRRFSPPRRTGSFGENPMNNTFKVPLVAINDRYRYEQRNIQDTNIRTEIIRHIGFCWPYEEVLFMAFSFLILIIPVSMLVTLVGHFSPGDMLYYTFSITFVLSIASPAIPG